jgi:excisionase family DNA binding protein
VNVTKVKEAAGPVRLLSVQEVADLLQVPVGTIYQWRVRGGGPKSLRVGRHLRFDPADLCRWIEHRKSASV